MFVLPVPKIRITYKNSEWRVSGFSFPQFLQLLIYDYYQKLCFIKFDLAGAYNQGAYYAIYSYAGFTGKQKIYVSNLGTYLLQHRLYDVHATPDYVLSGICVNHVKDARVLASGILRRHQAGSTPVLPDLCFSGNYRIIINCRLFIPLAWCKCEKASEINSHHK